MLDTLAVGICNILDEVVFDTLTYTFAEGSAQALKDAIQIASADITDASTVPVYNETTELYEEVAALYDGEGAINAVNFYSQGAFQSFDGDNYASFIVSDTPISWFFGTKQFSIKEPLGNGGQCTIPDASGTFALTSAANGEPDKLTAGTISGATTFNTTSYTYGTGAAAAHRTALGLTTLATTTPGTNVANFLEFPTSANLASAVSDETGSGSLVFATSPTIVTPAIRQNNASFTPLTVGTYVATFADNTDSVSGVQMGNVSSGTTADFRFLIKDNTNHYFAFSQPGTNNGLSLFGVLRSTADFIFNAGGTTRDMVIGTTDAKYLAFGTNNLQRLRITSSGEVGIGTTTPSAKSILDLASTTQGFLPPRMTTTQRNAISSPPAGLMIYNTTTNKLNVYTTAWEQVTSS